MGTFCFLLPCTKISGLGITSGLDYTFGQKRYEGPNLKTAQHFSSEPLHFLWSGGGVRSLLCQPAAVSRSTEGQAIVTLGLHSLKAPNLSGHGMSMTACAPWNTGEESVSILLCSSPQLTTEFSLVFCTQKMSQNICYSTAQHIILYECHPGQSPLRCQRTG